MFVLQGCGPSLLESVEAPQGEETVDTPDDDAAPGPVDNDNPTNLANEGPEDLVQASSVIDDVGC